jgi:hypothetical protein
MKLLYPIDVYENAGAVFRFPDVQRTKPCIAVGEQHHVEHVNAVMYLINPPGEIARFGI